MHAMLPKSPLILPLAVTGCLLLFAQDSPAHEADKKQAIGEMATAATRLLLALQPDQKELAALPFEAENEDAREDWHYIPKPTRKGLPLKDMTPEQRPLAHALLVSGMSQEGYITAATIISLEAVLAVMENAPDRRDPEKYYFTVFGEPADDATWGWSVEGHHLSINVTVVNGIYVAATPSFFGTNPAEIREGQRAGTRALAEEEDRGRELVNALVAAGINQAVIGDEAPNEILSGSERSIRPLEEAGVAASDLDEAQRDMLRNLVRIYIGRHRAEFAQADLDAYDAADPSAVTFAWAGGRERGDPHYYRVQSPDFLIEFANTQNDANHAHAVWRSFDGDFGRDLLREHLESSH
ncbi:DUF3500 domain-containing protein [soil metagenome]